MLLSVLICFYGKKISVSEFLRSARSSFLLFPIKKENRQRLYNLLSIFILKLINKNIRRYMCTAGYHIIIHSSVCKYYLLFRNPPLCHSSSTSAASPSPPGLAVLGWSLYMHQVSHLQRSQEVSQGIRPPEQSPAHMDSCQVHNS